MLLSGFFFSSIVLCSHSQLTDTYTSVKRPVSYYAQYHQLDEAHALVCSSRLYMCICPLNMIRVSCDSLSIIKFQTIILQSRPVSGRPGVEGTGKRERRATEKLMMAKSVAKIHEKSHSHTAAEQVSERAHCQMK